MKTIIALLGLLLLSTTAMAQGETSIDKSLSRHDFMYAGESTTPQMFIVKEGKVTWQYLNTVGKGEISDAVLLKDGNILIAHQYGIAEVAPDKSVVWHMDATPGTEIHTIQPAGRNHVVFVENAPTAKCVVMSIPDLKRVHEFELPTNKKASVHGQFRSCCLTSHGTILIANMNLGFLSEYDIDGNELLHIDFPKVWGVEETDKGTILVSNNKGLVCEYDFDGKKLWEYDARNTGGYETFSGQKAHRLKNGNTIMTSWFNEWGGKKPDPNNLPVQAIEVTQEGKVVWELCEWVNPNLGPATTIQPLSQAVDRDKCKFGKYSYFKWPKLFVEPNQPIGKGVGIHPGRVVWAHAPGVAKWDGKTGLWVEDRWNDQAKADEMVRVAVENLTGEMDTKKAWTALFKDFNKRHGKGNKGYKKGEMIAIKLNTNNAITHHDTIELNSSPYVTLGIVKSLVRDGGVREKDIVVCEPSRAITDSIYNKIHRLFPRVRFIDNLGGDGREKCEYYEHQIPYSIDNGKMAQGLAKCIVDAKYLINSALLKTHNGPGVTLTGKNWYGATDIKLLWRQNAHNNVSQDKRNGKIGYKTFVDFIGHKDLGQKCLLFVIDGTYGSCNVNGAPYPKWQKEPFNNDWCCSLIVSQDPLACDAVGMDMLIGEWPDYKSLPYCDEYLREAAMIPAPPSGTKYDPEGDGKPLVEPLGLMEHWNNPTERKYEKIDLVYKIIQ